MPPQDSVYTLSEYERLALTGCINLSDGHARHTLTTTQRDIIARSLRLFDQSLTRKQQDIESEFLSQFFNCAGQSYPSSKQGVYLNFSSSSAIKIAAQMCRIRGLTVHLIEPCFDNIVHLLRTEGVPVSAIREHHLADPDYINRLLNASSALWIVQPNNPTGFCLDQTAFIQLIEAVSRQGATLIVDYCFRFYANDLLCWDQYRLLQESQLSFLLFEDTGKTWPIADTKVGITVCSTNNIPILYRLHDELLLNVSPWHLLLLAEFIKHSVCAGLYSTVRKCVEINRGLVHELLGDDLVVHATRWCQNVPMELLSLSRGGSSTSLWANLRLDGVDVLPAKNYFWSRPEYGSSLFRIPLSRRCQDVEKAVPVIRRALIAHYRGIIR